MRRSVTTPYLVLGTTSNDTRLGLNRNDVIYGGSGDDKYLCHIGGEADTVIDSQGSNAFNVFGVTAKDTVSAKKKNSVITDYVNGAEIAKIDMRGAVPLTVCGFRISVCDSDGRDFAYAGSDSLNETAKNIINPTIYGELFGD